MDLKKLFEARFRKWPARGVRARAPVELLGTCAGWSGGLSLGLAVEPAIQMAGSTRVDGRIELASTHEAESFYCDRLDASGAPRWTEAFKRVLAALQQEGARIGGFEAVVNEEGIEQDGAGLRVAAALLARELYPYRMGKTISRVAPQRDRFGNLPPFDESEKLRLAELCADAAGDEDGTGFSSGATALFHRPGHAVEVDSLHRKAAAVPWAPGVVLLLARPSPPAWEPWAGRPLEARRLLARIAKKMAVRQLREADAALLEKRGGRLGPEEWECARHMIEENRRVTAAAACLHRGEIEMIGEHMFQSHASLMQTAWAPPREADELVAIARSQPGCLGARAAGPGRGGTTLNLVRHEDAGLFMGSMKAQYAAKAGRRVELSLKSAI